MTDFTPNYLFAQPDFNQRGWHDLINTNFTMIDTLLGQLDGISIVAGIWDNSVDYEVGDKVFDTDGYTIYECLVQHTSAASGTFAADRAANPTYWQVDTVGAEIDGSPSAEQLAVFSGGTSLEGDANLTWDGSELGVTGTLDVSGAVALGDALTVVGNITAPNVLPGKTNATAAPDADDDGAGTGGEDPFSVGSIWVDVTNDEAYVCLDNTTSAAVWKRLTFDSFSEDTSPTAGGNLSMGNKQLRLSKGADVASAGALTLGSDGNFFDITGATTITSIGTKGIGTRVTLHFDSSLTLTHHSTDLILPDGANIVTAAGDIAEFVEYATGDWVCVSFQPKTRLITQSAAEAGTDTIPKEWSAERVAQAIAAQVSASVFQMPVGTVVPYAGTTEPDGWVFCDGDEYDETVLVDLFAAIGSTFNTGGETSGYFRVPDLMGRVVAGKDDMSGASANRLTDQSGGVNGDVLGDTGGAETHQLTSTELAAHSHTATPSAGTRALKASGSTPGIDTDGANTDLYGNDTLAVAISNTGGDGAHNNVQPTMILNYIIFTGVYS